jgi:DNA invertase Pin-like site-specific DNA recombinase
MRARVWLRVSTDDQDEEQQYQPCARRIEYGDQGNAWEFESATGIYRAHGVHGDDVDNRIRARVFADAEAGLFERLVVYELSRWTRGGILTVLQDRDRFAKLGVTIVSVREEWLSNELLLVIAAWMDKQKLVTVRDETRKALQYRIQQIERNGGFWKKDKEGRESVWISNLGRPVVKIPDEAVTRAIELRGRLSWRDITRQLRQEGPKTVKGVPLWDFKHATIAAACQKRDPNLRRGRPGWARA